MPTIRTKLTTAALVIGAAAGGATLASAASNATSTTPSASSSQSAQPQGRHSVNGKTETALTGDTAAKVKAAALAKVSGTVDRLETNVDDSAPYEAHITKSDGSQVIVEVNSDFTVSSVSAMGAGHP